ncbi:GrpB family protein [Paenibacillus silvisoli]|uniref:GrpB family protein n=1 Tax=Paenibacillus silvisoli TaxID=3110539 RepID=UPI0028052B02|nr:GrpB family protein [Paenibacillus silvisoli]
MSDKRSDVEELDIRVVPYDPIWPDLYTGEARLIREAVADLVVSIEHFGSTSVRGLDAKPIVDILVGAPSDVRLTEAHIEALEKLSYTFLGEDGRRPGRFFFRKRGLNHYNLSVVPYDGALWRDNLILRDFLRVHADEVSRYAAIKIAAAQASPNSLLGYQDYKRTFVEEMKERARAWSRGLHEH